MPKVKQELQDLNEDKTIAPTLIGKAEYPKGETLILFGYDMYNKKRFRPFYGVGVVCRVVKRERVDLIYVNFGMFSNHQTRVVVAYDNHSRRQVLTLKRGQVCQVYGICRTYRTECEVNGEKRYGIRLGLYAKGILGWYVPTMMDIRKMPINEDLVNATDKEEELGNMFEDVLDQFLNGSGEE